MNLCMRRPHPCVEMRTAVSVFVQVTSLLDNLEFLVVPFVNPDGYVVHTKFILPSVPQSLLSFPPIPPTLLLYPPSSSLLLLPLSSLNSPSPSLSPSFTVYKAAGLGAYDLYDEVDYDTWYSTQLINELRIQDTRSEIFLVI